MDDLTLVLLVLVFFTGLVLYFATVAPPPPPPPARKPSTPIHIHPVLRSNVAVARLVERGF